MIKQCGCQPTTQRGAKIFPLCQKAVLRAKSFTLDVTSRRRDNKDMTLIASLLLVPFLRQKTSLERRDTDIDAEPTCPTRSHELSPSLRSELLQRSFDFRTHLLVFMVEVKLMLCDRHAPQSFDQILTLAKENEDNQTTRGKQGPRVGAGLNQRTGTRQKKMKRGLHFMFQEEKERTHRISSSSWPGLEASPVLTPNQSWTQRKY